MSHQSSCHKIKSKSPTVIVPGINKPSSEGGSCENVHVNWLSSPIYSYLQTLYIDNFLQGSVSTTGRCYEPTTLKADTLIAFSNLYLW